MNNHHIAKQGRVSNSNLKLWVIKL